MATPKFDIETYLGEIRTLLGTYLNAKIAEINAEKSDSITLKTIDQNAFFLQELNGKQVNYNPFVLYGLESINSTPIKGHSFQELTTTVVLILEDQGDLTISNRMLRYQRALKEVIEDHFQLVRSASILKVQSLMPVLFNSLNSNDRYRAVGVNINSVLG